MRITNPVQANRHAQSSPRATKISLVRSRPTSRRAAILNVCRLPADDVHRFEHDDRREHGKYGCDDQHLFLLICVEPLAIDGAKSLSASLFQLALFLDASRAD